MVIHGENFPDLAENPAECDIGNKNTLMKTGNNPPYINTKFWLGDPLTKIELGMFLDILLFFLSFCFKM